MKTEPLHSQKTEYTFVVVGAGIVGMCIARELLTKYPGKPIAIIDKEPTVAIHGSGRNSGVLHAGFYYSADSLKAKFTVDGNRTMKEYCRENKLALNECGKVVVVKDKSELSGLDDLFHRGKKNGVQLEKITSDQLKEIEPNAKSYEYALYSPSTATIDPKQIMVCMESELRKKGVSFYFNESFSKRIDHASFVTSSGSIFVAKKMINCAGLYADKIAQEYGFSLSYTILPFKGIYLKYSGEDKPIGVNIYPVPNLKNPFLGVHYTVTVNNHIKIGPTAIPAFWRENYHGLSRFSVSELLSITAIEASLFIKNSFNFRSLVYDEMKKYWKPAFTKLAIDLVHKINEKGFTTWSEPGIRAQLLNKETNELVQDFIVEGDENSVHVLNAVSPAFTCSIPFAKYVVDNYVKHEG